MAFTLTNYAAAPSKEFSPFDKLVQNLMSGYAQATQNQFLRPSLEQELLKAQQYNQFYPKDIQSQIANRQAQTGLIGSQTQRQNITNQYLPQSLMAQIGLTGNQSALTGNQAQALGIQNQYLPQLQQAKVQEQLAASKKAQVLAQAMGMAFPEQGQQQSQQNTMQPQGGYSPIPQQGMMQGEQSSMGQMQPQSGQMQSGFPMQGQVQPPMEQNVPRGTSEIGKTPNGMNYTQAGLLTKALGLPDPKIVDVNGKMIAITPFGNIDTGIQGPTKLQAALAGADAKTIQDMDQLALNAYNKQVPLDMLSESVSSPLFESIRTLPIGGTLEMFSKGQMGTKQQQELVGQVEAGMGDIIKSSARDFPGQFRSGEQKLLYSMKPNPSDTIDRMKGKLEALSYFNKMMLKRSEIQSEQMRNGIPPLKAAQIADNLIDSKKIKEEIHDKLHPERPTASGIMEELKKRGKM